MAILSRAERDRMRRVMDSAWERMSEEAPFGMGDLRAALDTCDALEAERDALRAERRAFAGRAKEALSAGDDHLRTVLVADLAACEDGKPDTAASGEA